MNDDREPIHPVGDHSDCLDISDLHSPDAREVIRFILARMIRGEAEYGLLDLDTDPRDFKEESYEESADKAVYDAIDALRELRRAKRRRGVRTMTLTPTE